MKGYVRIGGAALVGITVILGAFYLRTDDTESATEGSVVVAETPIREYIPATDSDGDGIKDWEENLRASVFEAIPTPTTTQNRDETATYTPPTTFTGKFSEAFLESYLGNKIALEDTEASMSEEAKMQMVEDAMTAIARNTQSKRHSKAEFIVIEDSYESIKEYGNAIGELLRGPDVDTENEIILLQRALEAKDEKALEQLAVNQAGYTTMINAALSTDVPASMSTAHLNLVNALEAIRTDIEAMRAAFSDPLFTLARMQHYENDANDFAKALHGIAYVLAKNKTEYTKDDPGAFFTLIDL